MARPSLLLLRFWQRRAFSSGAGNPDLVASGDMVLYRTSRPWLPAAALAVGGTMLVFWGNVSYTLYQLLSQTHIVSASDLGDAEPGSLAGRLPVFLKRVPEDNNNNNNGEEEQGHQVHQERIASARPIPNGSLPSLLSPHGQEEVPSPLRAYIASLITLQLGIGTAFFAYRLSGRLVHDIVYHPSRRAVTLRYGFRARKTLTVPQTNVEISAPVAKMRAARSPTIMVRASTTAEPVAYALESNAEWASDGRVMDSLFLRGMRA
ncbi:hypothetical protein BC828DRAFT_393135 [Blastocladiella britannica]|nr:hypothetical protein BC828DRAFT_393135 [Blastocladiella britannica]